MRRAVNYLTVSILACLPAHAQPVARAAFEVASVKPMRPGVGLKLAGGPGISDPGQWSCVSCPLAILLTHAYKIFEYQLIAPEWARTTGFDVVAKVPPGATTAEFAQMLQSLLEERFQMTVHRENRETPVYELAIAKGGPKLQEVDKPAPAPPPGPELDKDGFPNVPGGNGWRMLNGRARIQFRAQTMANLAHLLSVQAGRPVLDATGLKGK
jgi:uncharacterized protein (TIGR03435 family)